MSFSMLKFTWLSFVQVVNDLLLCLLIANGLDLVGAL